MASESHRSFIITFKLQAVETAEQTSKSAAAKSFNVDPKRIREWCKQKDKLLMKKRCGESKKKRLNGGGRKVMYEDMEIVFDWIAK